MSVRVWSLVFKHFPYGGSLLNGMLALADYGNDEGLNIYPSVAEFAQKIKCSEVQARRVLHDLIKEGYLQVIGNEMGGAPGTSRRYRLNLERLTPLTDDTRTPLTDDTRTHPYTGLIHDRDGSHLGTETPLTGESLTVIRTVKNRKKPPPRADAQHQQPAARTQRAKRTPCPEDWRGLVDYAWSQKALGWDTERTDLQTERFLNWVQGKKILRADWSRAWRDSMLRQKDWEMW